jgi:hypothetical protein
MAMVMPNWQVTTHGARRPGRLAPAIGLLLVALLAFDVLIPFPAESATTEYEVKAAYLYQFGKFVEWPEGGLSRTDDPFAICIVGTDPFGAVLDETISGRTVQDKKVIAKRLTPTDDKSSCNILFVSPSEQHRLVNVLREVSGRSILTVGTTAEFLSQGGMINFRLEQGKVRFEVNLAALQQGNLKMSSELLKVATLIKQ